MVLSEAEKKRSSSAGFIIRIRQEDGLAVKGSIEDVQNGRVRNFEDFLELVFLMNLAIEEKGSPQCDSALREF